MTVGQVSVQAYLRPKKWGGKEEKKTFKILCLVMQFKAYQQWKAISWQELLWISNTENIFVYPVNSHSTVWPVYNSKDNCNGSSISPLVLKPNLTFSFICRMSLFQVKQKQCYFQHLPCPGNLLMTGLEWFCGHTVSASVVQWCLLR